MRLSDGLFCWVSEGVEGRIHDMRLFKEGGILNLLHPEEKVLGDKGYVGHPKILTPKKGKNLEEEDKERNITLNRRRIVVENSFAKLKKFGCLTLPFRHGIDVQEKVFFICVQITNMKMKEE